MPADWNPGTQFIQAFSVGSQSAVQGFEAGMRMQQLRSEQAMRQLQERQAAETLSYAMHQHQAAIQQEADTAKANAVFQSLITPALSMQVPVAGPPTADGQSLGTASVKVANPAYEPDTGKAMIRAFSPTIRTPAEAERLVMDAATVNYHLGEAKRQEALSRQSVVPKPLSNIGKMQADRELAIQNGDLSSAAEIDDSIAKLHSNAASDVQKIVEEHDRLTKTPFTPAEIDDLYRIKTGLKPKAAVVQPVTFEQFAHKHLDEFLENARHFDPKTQKLRRPTTVEEAMADMRLAYDSMKDHIASVPPLDYNGLPHSPAGVDQSVPEEKVTVVDPQGKRFKVLRRQLDAAKLKGLKEVKP